MESNKYFLVTGISGFLGLHLAIKLLKKGYKVRGTLRDLKKIDKINEIIAEHCGNRAQVDLVKGELTNPHHWDNAMENIDYVFHVASPLPYDMKKSEEDLIIPAREGTVNVIYAAIKHNVKRIVMTSSVSAVGFNSDVKQESFNESHWTNVETLGHGNGYAKSKTLAEKSAWDLINNTDNGPELVTINPGFIFGPLLEKDYPDSARILLAIMRGKYPGMPKIGIPIVDVRDVADMHVLAMEIPEAAGNRFICSNESMWIRDIASCLAQAFPEYGVKIKIREIPNSIIKFLGIFNPSLKTMNPLLGKIRHYDSNKSRKMLGWEPRSNKEAIVSMGQSIIDLKLALIRYQ